MNWNKVNKIATYTVICITCICLMAIVISATVFIVVSTSNFMIGG